MGDLAIFSFYPGKNLGAYGEGGLVTTNNPEHDKQIRMLRNWGTEQRYYHVLKGFNYRMEGIQGAVLRVKLKYLERWTEARRVNAAIYTELLAGSDVVTPTVMADRRHVFHVYAILTGDRKGLTERLAAKQIQFGIHYPQPIHLMQAHADLGHKVGDFPVSEGICERVLSLPLFPEMTRGQIETVCEVVLPSL
jgi:dTDP-4-amino-4,6-dideoxygalactose transaminase